MEEALLSKNIGLKVKIFRKMEEISPEEWNSVFPDVLESHSFFKTLDESGFEQFSFYYILVYEGDTPVGATACFRMDYPLDTTAGGALKNVFSAAKKFLPHAFNLKVLICGLPISQGRFGIASDNPQRVVHAIIEAMEQIAREEKVAIIAFKDFGMEQVPLLDPLQRRGFHKFESLPSTKLDIGFGNFEEYLKTLSKATRYDLRRKFKKVEQLAKIEMEVTDELDGTLDQVYELYSQTKAKGDIQFENVPKEFFSRLSKNMPGKVKYFLWRLDQRLVAFVVGLVSKDFFLDYYIGLDYSVAYDYHLYFLRFRDMMNWCLENKIKTYEMGTSSYEPKKRLGFELIPLFVYFKHRHPLINPLFKILTALLKPQNFDKDLKKMKRASS